jgi:hypothetical protein
MPETSKSTVTPLPIRRRDDAPASTTETARRSSPAFAAQLPVQLPVDLPINLPDFNESPAGIARRARLAAANKAQTESLERKLQVERRHKAEVRLVRELAYAKGRNDGRLRDRLMGTLFGMALGGIVVATSMALGFRAWHS